MKEWQKTSCILCAQNCGLEVLIENNRMTKVKPDRENPRSEGYACRKGMKILNYQNQDGRLTTPLKRVGDQFEAITWDQAIDEIAAGMRKLVDTNGPKCLAYMGASSQGGHFEASLAFHCSGPWDHNTFTPLPDRNSVVPGGCLAGCLASSTTLQFPMNTKRRCLSAGAGTVCRVTRCPKPPRY